MATSALNLAITPESFVWSLESISKDRRVPLSAAALIREFPPPHDLASVQLAAQALGIHAEVGMRSVADLKAAADPCCEHFVLVRDPARLDPPVVPPNAFLPPSPADAGRQRLIRMIRYDQDAVVVRESAEYPEAVLTPAQFEAIYTGHALELPVPQQAPGVTLEDPAPLPSFGLRWFAREMLRYPGIWRDVVLACAAVQLMALVVPLLTQVIIDKVLVHRTVNAMHVYVKHYDNALIVRY